MVLAAGAMGIALWLTQNAVFATSLHGLVRMGALAVLVGAGLAAYGAGAVVFGAVDWRMFVRKPLVAAMKRGRS
jgi:hypothetical protein